MTDKEKNINSYVSKHGHLGFSKNLYLQINNKNI